MEARRRTQLANRTAAAAAAAAAERLPIEAVETLPAE